MDLLIDIDVPNLIAFYSDAFGLRRDPPVQDAAVQPRADKANLPADVARQRPFGSPCAIGRCPRPTGEGIRLLEKEVGMRPA